MDNCQQPPGQHLPVCFRYPLLQRRQQQASRQQPPPQPPTPEYRAPPAADGNKKPFRGPSRRATKQRARMAESLAACEGDAARISAEQCAPGIEPERVDFLEKKLERVNLAAANIAATGQHINIRNSGTGFFRTVDANGNPCALRFGKALHSPHVHNLLSPGAMIEQDSVKSIRLRRHGSYIRLHSGEKLPLRYDNRLFYLDYQTSSNRTIGASADTACHLQPATAPLARLPREAFYEAPTCSITPVSEITDFLPPLPSSRYASGEPTPPPSRTCHTLYEPAYRQCAHQPGCTRSFLPTSLSQLNSMRPMLRLRRRRPQLLSLLVGLDVVPVCNCLDSAPQLIHDENLQHPSVFGVLDVSSECLY